MQKDLPEKISLKEIILILHCKENIILPLTGTKEKKTTEWRSDAALGVR